MNISGRTQVVGIIGDPVAHSFSPAMHNAAFRALKLDFVYAAFPVRPMGLRAALAGIRALGIAGVNVTVPHKERVIAFLDSVSDMGRRVGAVNTVVNRGGHLHGENTDVVGFLRALRDVKFRLRGARVLVVGAGGVARAVLMALADGAAASVIVANRTPRRAQQLAAAVDTKRLRVTVSTLAVLQEPDVLAPLDLVVNATSLGLHGEKFPPLAYLASQPRCLFFDLIYGGHTDFQAGALHAGRPTLDGSSMLLHQGAAAFTLWTGRRAPLTVMRATLCRSKPREN